MKQITYKTANLFLEKNKSGKLIIFSHGFGVRWDSRGMFTEIAQNLKGYDFIFFDYTNIDSDGNTYVESVHEQVQTLEDVLEFAKSRAYKEINIITHSFGVVAPLKINDEVINKLIILAPPTVINKQRQLDKLKAKPGSIINLEGYSTVVRSDGTKTFINKTFYESVDDIDFFSMINENDSKEIKIIMALEDEIVENIYPKGKLNPNIEKIDIHGDHNFKNEFRKELLTKVAEIFNS